MCQYKIFNLKKQKFATGSRSCYNLVSMLLPHGIEI